MNISTDQKQDGIPEIENNEEFYSLFTRQSALIDNIMTDENLKQFDIIHQLIGEKIESLKRLRSSKIDIKPNDEMPCLEDSDDHSDEMPGLEDPADEIPSLEPIS